MRPRKVPGLGEIRPVTDVNGDTYVCVDWTRQMLGLPPVAARELATALLAAADEAEATDAAVAAQPVQGALWEAA
jgi:hypothetical protein